MQLKQKVENLLQKLNDGVVEKEEAIRLALLSAIAGESIFLLGAPGVAKSLIARRLKFAFKDATNFEYLMNRFSTPDEIFGPVSISKLKNEDKYERIVKNYLPSADVVFLDEIWKAGPSIQNTLLTVINEKIYRNGEQEIKIPLKALIAASNELPAQNEGLEALWDRFLVRLVVDGINDKKNFNTMITQTTNPYEDNVSEDLKIDGEDYKLLNLEINNVKIPEKVFNVIHMIRSYIHEYNTKEENKDNPLYISDRRWRKIIRLLRTSALLNGRNEVDLMDCFLIQYCIWNETEQIPVAQQFVKDAIQKHGYSLTFNLEAIKKELEEFKNEIKMETSVIKSIQKEVPVEHVFNGQVYYKILSYRNGELYIKKNDFDNLALLALNENMNVSLYYKDRGIFYGHTVINCRKSNDDNTIQINGNSYQINGNSYKLETQNIGDKRKITRKPHKKVEEDWDNRVNQYLTVISKNKNQIAEFKRNDLKHITTNLFVPADRASIVESNLNSTQKDLEKLEIEVKQIQHNYKNIKEKEEIITDNGSK